MPRKMPAQPLASPAQAFYVPGEFHPDQSAGYLMRKVIGSIREQANARLAAHDLTYVQWVPLYKLAMKQGNTVASLARELEIDAGAMTRSMNRLEAKGLVRRERSTDDRRVVFLVLTVEGRRVARKVPTVLSEVLNTHLQDFSEAEWRLLLQFLNRMLANGQSMRGLP